jgi:hypothetical protein
MGYKMISLTEFGKQLLDICLGKDA